MAWRARADETVALTLATAAAPEPAAPQPPAPQPATPQEPTAPEPAAAPATVPPPAPLAVQEPVAAPETVAPPEPAVVHEPAPPAPRPIRVPARIPPAKPFVRFGTVAVGGVEHHAYRFEGHVHTAHSLDARHRTLDVLEAAERAGLDALIITDHGASAARLEFSGYRGALKPFVGREIGGDFGHAVIWNVADDTLNTELSLAQRSRFAHERGGLLVLAHPGWWIDGRARDPMEWMTPEALRRGGIAGDVDAIELWNGVYSRPLPKLIAAWVSLLEAGVYVPIVGNSDFHRGGFHRLGSVHNVAFCARPELDACLWPAVRAGQLVVTDGPAAVLSVNDRLPGSVVRSEGGALRVAVEALAPEGGLLRVYLGKQMVQTLALAPGQRIQQSWQVASPAQDSFVRIDIERPGARADQPPVSLLSNPVLIDVGAARASWR